MFKITLSGIFKVISGFDRVNGGNPYSSVIQGKDGNFYGTASGWGGLGSGTIYKVSRNGSLTTLYDFNGNTDGGGPYAGLVEATDGNFYGAASGGGFSNGTIYSISGTGSFSVLHSFDGVNGSSPTVTPVQHTTGIFFGNTTCGGTGINGGCIAGNGGGGVMYSLDLGLTPFVSLLPTSSKVAKTVEFLGQGLTGTTKVSFAGRPAQFSVKSDTFLTATVPSGAVSGYVTVTTPSGILKSNKQFLVTPQLLSFDPPSGPPGTQVTITGVSLTQTLGVGFGDRVQSQFTVNSDTSVTATVPQGAKTGKIGIETKGGVAISSGTFEVTE